MRSVEIFCALLGSAAGDFTISCGAFGGTYIAGGIVPRIIPLLEDSNFMIRFTHKGAMMSRLQEVPVNIIIESHTGLLGAAVESIQRTP